MPPGAASHQDEDRLLQGWKTQRDVSERRVRLPRLWIPTAAGPKLSKRATVLQLHTRGQFLGTESHAGDDPGLEHPATDTAVAGRHRPQAQPAPQRVDRILRALRAFGIVSDAQVRQSEPSWRFWGLYVHVCKVETLRAAY